MKRIRFERITKSLLSFAVVLSSFLLLMGCSKSEEVVKGSDTLKGTYSIFIGGYDWGAGTSKAIISLDYPLDAVNKDDFTVTETKMATDFTDVPAFPVEEVTVERKITKAYLSDENGQEVEDAAKYVVLELYVSPNDGSPLLFSLPSQYNTWSNPYYLTIELSENATLTSAATEVTNLTIDEEYTEKTTAADNFSKESFEASDGVKYEYAYYEPKAKSDTLVVWLHGLGEGGVTDTDPNVTLLGNKVTALAEEEFQEKLGNANILVPQSPTYWMDKDGEATNFNNGAIVAEATSYYTESLNELINEYKEKVGAKKVVLAGCSNGGYMTMVMAINYPEQFDAIVPICEALPDELISDEQIQSISTIPAFFIYSEDDTTVDPSLHEIPTIERLKKAGAKNLLVSTTEHVVDTSGEYKDEEGNPYQYMGHWSWIYFDNNESKDNETGELVWDWLGEQVQ